MPLIQYTHAGTVAVTILCSEDLAEYTAALSIFKLSDGCPEAQECSCGR